MEKLRPTFRMEPGDGTGQSIADSEARNDKGICGNLNCGGKITEDSTNNGVFGKLCYGCEKRHRRFLEKLIGECLGL